ncbi:hypothetical protein, partial [Klebsiella pneumoniae]|uniref:hypothetical protein n=1 Tax=Klebsiella pneumoniae TaxID=573 RepID=UPI001C694917
MQLSVSFGAFTVFPSRNRPPFTLVHSHAAAQKLSGASDVQWQIDNGYLAQVMGDFSTESPSFETPMFGRYFDTFQAAIHVAKAFPGSTLQPSEYEDKTGMLIRHYYVDCHPYYDRLPPEKSD